MVDLEDESKEYPVSKGWKEGFKAGATGTPMVLDPHNPENKSIIQGSVAGDLVRVDDFLDPDTSKPSSSEKNAKRMLGGKKRR